MSTSKEGQGDLYSLIYRMAKRESFYESIIDNVIRYAKEQREKSDKSEPFLDDGTIYRDDVAEELFEITKPYAVYKLQQEKQ